MNEHQLKYLCNKYNIKYQIFEGTGTILLDSGCDEWQIKYIPHKHKPYCLMHKNKFKQKNKYHIQRHLRTLYQSIDSIANHKGLLTSIYGSHNTYNKNKNAYKNNRIS